MVATSDTPRIIAIGELLWDILPTGPRLGGAPANFAVLCGRLGNHAALASSVGEDEYGKAARALLSNANLDLSLLQQTTQPTGTVEVTFTADRQPHYVIHSEVAWDYLRLTPETLHATGSVHAICFGTLGQRQEVSRSTIRGFVEAAPSQCVRVCDVNLRTPFYTPEVLAWSLSHATIIKSSDEELLEVFSLLGEPSPVNTQAAAYSLLQRFPSCLLVALTLGSHGCLLTTREAVFAHPGFPIDQVYPVGAGDAFTAGLVHAYLRGALLPQMAEIGNLCGSYVASLPEATPQLSPELIERIHSILSVAHES